MSEKAHSVDSAVKGVVGPDGGPSGGEFLRRQREARGLSVADVAGSLKVAVRRVEAIEAGEWSSLLPAPYLRGFVRAYAKLVQADPAPVLADIELSLGVAQGRLPDTIEPLNHRTTLCGARKRAIDRAAATSSLPKIRPRGDSIVGGDPARVWPRTVP